MKRRDFLKAILAAAGVAMLPAPAHASNRKLVLIHLFGGNDGLNTVVNDSALYRRLRPSLALRSDETIAHRGGLRLHRALAPLGNQMAIVNGVGYPDPDRSHFRSTDIWQTAVTRGTSADGWLGRFLERQGGEGVNVGGTLPRALYGGRSICLTDPSPHLEERHQLAGMYRDFGGHLGHTFARLESVLDRVPQCEGEAVAPNDLGKALDVILKLLPLGRVFCTSLSGFDTHANQREGQARSLDQLAQALTAFLPKLGKDTLVLVYSEFGRRVEENASAGTDHGTAGLLFVLGSGVKAGLYGEYPSLSNLREGDLVHTVDFRQVYATLLSRWLETDPTTVLGSRYEALPFL